MRPQAGVTLVL